MHAKSGRPTEIAKIITIKARIDANFQEKLNLCAKKLNMTKSDIIRNGIEAIYSNICQDRSVR